VSLEENCILGELLLVLQVKTHIMKVQNYDKDSIKILF